jgi:hypothetical protein
MRFRGFKDVASLHPGTYGSALSAISALVPISRNRYV